jgi:hypothetical protein
MSLIFLIGCLGIYFGAIPEYELTVEYLVVWALFAIADALWVRGSSK